jgi:hypothetical protein
MNNNPPPKVTWLDPKWFHNLMFVCLIQEDNESANNSYQTMHAIDKHSVTRTIKTRLFDFEVRSFFFIVKKKRYQSILSDLCQMHFRDTGIYLLIKPVSYSITKSL